MTKPGSGPAISAPLLAVGLLAGVVFGVLTIAAAARPYLPFDVPVTRAIQSVPWGPLTAAFDAVDWLEGVRQVAAAAAGLVLVLLWNRRAVPLYLACALSGAAYSLTELLVARPRPPAALVHVVRHTAGFSYPSGHVVFFCWFLPVLVLAVVRPHLPRAFEVAGWIVALAVVGLVGIGRVDVGEHWPSDVLGGVALGVAWTALALSVRVLSGPVRGGSGSPPSRTGRERPALLWG